MDNAEAIAPPQEQEQERVIVYPRIVRESAHGLDINRVLNMPAATYHSDKSAISQGALQTIETTPAHFANEWEKPYIDSEGSEEMLLGTLCHEALLEPELYGARIVKPEFGDQRYKENKEAKAAWVKGCPPGSKLISEAHKRTVECMAMNVLAKKEMRDAIAAAQKEATIYWIDEVTLILNRARLDMLLPGIVLDLKTVGKFMASEEAFSKAIANNGYDFQGGHYLTAADHAAKKIDSHTRYRFCVVEREPPFAVGLYWLDEGDIARAKARRSIALSKLRNALDLGRFDDYGDDFKPISVPYWAKTKKIQTEAF